MPAFTRRQFVGSAVPTVTTSSLGVSDTSVTLSATTGWPTGPEPFYVVVSPGSSAEEKCLATISGSTLTLTRAQDDTTAQTHASGSTIYPVFTANDADEANEVAAKLTTKGDLLVTTGSALNRLAVGANDHVLTADSAATNGVKWGQVVAAGLASDAVTTAKILDANVTTAKIADANVTGAKLANLAVGVKTGDYTLVVGDRNTRVVADKSSAIKFTVPDGVFSAGDVVLVHNINAGTLTLEAGSGMTLNTSGALTLAQWEGGVIYFTGASSSIFFRGGGADPITVEYLVIGGGGGGGGMGGGGAGGYLNSVTGEDSGGGDAARDALTVAPGGSLSVTVGGGGAGGAGGAVGSSGTPSRLGGVFGVGGGGGGGFSNTDAKGVAGGSGGGGGTDSGSPFTGRVGGVGTSGQGFAGGSGATGGAAGGGGGSDAAGANAVTSTGGNGGAGNSSSITGSSVGRGGGGGGGASSANGTGTDGGGNGRGGGAPTNGTANTGGGGGGGYNNTGANGGSGVVIIRYPNSYGTLASIGGGLTSTTGTYTSGSTVYRYYSFTAGTDTITFPG